MALLAGYSGKKAKKFLGELSTEFDRREEIIKEKDVVISQKNVHIVSLQLINYLTEKKILLEADLECRNTSTFLVITEATL